MLKEDLVSIKVGKIEQQSLTGLLELFEQKVLKQGWKQDVEKYI